MINFDTKTHGFCERMLYGGYPPEYINAFTSLFLTFSGLMGLFASNNVNTLGKIYYASFVVNGIGSFGYHWTNYIGWRYIDEFSMVILALASLLSVTNCLINKICLHKHWRKSSMYSISTLIIVSYLIITLVFDSLDDVISFRYSFGVFLAVAAIEVSILTYLNRDIKSDILKYNYIGFGLIALSCIMWSFIELLCYNQSTAWVKYIPGHAIWHIGLSFGGYYLAQIIDYITALDLDCYPKFITTSWYQKLYPKIDCESKNYFYYGLLD